MTNLNAQRVRNVPSPDERNRVARWMPCLVLVAVALTGCGGGGGEPGTPPAPEQAGPNAWSVLVMDALHDGSRERNVPTTLYVPDGEGAHPLLVLSHGAAATRDSYRYLAQHLASHGFVVLVPAHVGSDIDAVLDLRASMDITLGEATALVAADTNEYVDRSQDVSFLLDQAALWDAPGGVLAGRLRTDEVGVTGHSFGAFTALAVGGVLAGLPGGLTSLIDSRIDALVALSPQGTGGTGGFELESFDTIAVPALLVSGTEDDGFEGQSPSWRREGFDRMPAGNRYLAWLTNATHLHFVHGSTGQGGMDTHHIVGGLAAAFFLRFVAGDARYDTTLSASFAQGLAGQAIPAVAWSAK